MHGGTVRHRTANTPTECQLDHRVKRVHVQLNEEQGEADAADSEGEGRVSAHRAPVLVDVCSDAAGEGSAREHELHHPVDWRGTDSQAAIWKSI